MAHAVADIDGVDVFVLLVTTDASDELLGFVLLVDRVETLELELATKALVEEMDFEEDVRVAEVGLPLAQTSCVEPISQAPGVNDSKTIELIASKLAPINTLRGTEIISVLPVIVVGTV